MLEISPVALTGLGILIAVGLTFFLTRKFESAIFWAVLLGPAIGTSLIHALLSVLSGESLANVNFSYLPFVIAPIDKSFFAPESGDLAIIGAGILFLWIYVLAHFLTHWKGVWGIPILPLLIWILGLSLPNLRSRISTALPATSFLTDPLLGVGGLILISVPLFLFAYLIWRRGYQMRIPMWEKVKIK